MSSAPRLADLPADVRAIVVAALVAAERAAFIEKTGGDAPPVEMSGPVPGTASGASPSGPSRRRRRAAA